MENRKVKIKYLIETDMEELNRILNEDEEMDSEDFELYIYTAISPSEVNQFLEESSTAECTVEGVRIEG